MEGICGVFRPDLIPEWFSRIGPGLAACVAVAIYALNRRHATKDLKRRRDTLRAALKSHLLSAADFSMDTIPQLRTPHIFGCGTKEVIQRALLSLRLCGIERLFELQGELFKIGSEGDDLLSEFIESCRRYDAAHSQWSKVFSQDLVPPWDKVVECMRRNLLMDLELVKESADAIRIMEA